MSSSRPDRDKWRVITGNHQDMIIPPSQSLTKEQPQIESDQQPRRQECVRLLQRLMHSHIAATPRATSRSRRRRILVMCWHRSHPNVPNPTVLGSESGRSEEALFRAQKCADSDDALTPFDRPRSQAPVQLLPSASARLRGSSATPHPCRSDCEHPHSHFGRDAAVLRSEFGQIH